MFQVSRLYNYSLSRSKKIPSSVFVNRFSSFSDFQKQLNVKGKDNDRNLFFIWQTESLESPKKKRRLWLWALLAVGGAATFVGNVYLQILNLRSQFRIYTLQSSERYGIYQYNKDFVWSCWTNYKDQDSIFEC